MLVNHFIFYPQKALPQEYQNLPAPVRDIELQSADGISIHGLYLKQPDAKAPVILHFHGNAGHVYHRIPTALRLYQMGYTVLLCEYRGYGRSQGSPSESGIYRDARTAYKFLVEQEGYQPGRIFYYGRSLGSAVAIELAQEHPPAALLLITPFASAYDVARRSGYGVFALVAWGAFDSETRIRNIHAPTLVIHGDQDRIIPLESAQQLYAASPAQKEFVLISNAHHNDIDLVDPATFWDRLEQFIVKLN